MVSPNEITTEENVVDYLIVDFGMYEEKAREICNNHVNILHRCINDEEIVENTVTLLLAAERSRIGCVGGRLPEDYWEEDFLDDPDWIDDEDDLWEDDEDDLWEDDEDDED